MFSFPYLLLDSLTQWGGFFVLVTTICIMLFFKRSERNYSLISLLLMGGAGSFLMLSTNNLILSFIGLLFLFLSNSIMISLEKKKTALKYFILSGVSAAFFLMGLAFIYGVAQTLMISRLAESAPMWMGSEPLFVAGMLFLIVGIGFPLTISPFHSWAPEVFQDVATPIMTFLITVGKIGGIILLARIFLTYPLTGNESFAFALQVVSVLTSLFGSIMIFKKEDLKSVFGYFSIANSGYILLVLAVLGVSAFPSVLLGVLFFYVLIDIVMNLGGLAFHNSVEKNQKGIIVLQELNGLYKNHRFFAICFSICLLSLSGLPPVSGFFSRVFLFESLLEEGISYWILFGVLLSSTFFTVCCLRILSRLFSKKPPISVLQPDKLSGSILVLIISSIILLFGGLVSKNFLTLF